MDEGWGVGGLDGSRFVPPPLFARAPPAPASHDSLFALPQHPSIPRVASFDLFSAAEENARGGGAGAGGGGGARVRGDSSSSAYSPHPVISVPQGFNPRPPPYIINITFAPRAGTPLRRVPRGTPSPRARTSTNPLPPRASPPTPPRWSRGNPTACSPPTSPPWRARAPRLRLHRRQLEDPPAAPVDQPTGPPRRPQAREHLTPGRRYRGPHLEYPRFISRAASRHQRRRTSPRSRPAPPGFPGSPRGATPVSIPPLPPRAAPRDYAAAVATAAATSDADAPAPPPRVITGEAHAILEAKLLYHSLSAETRFDLPRLDDAANARRDETHDASSAFQRLALPPPATPRDVRAMVPWAPGDVRRSRPDANADETADANGDARRLTADGGAASDRRSPPASVASLGALQLRGPAKAVARAAAAAAGAGVTLARNPYETPEEDEDAEDVAEDDAGDDAASDADSDGNARRSGSGARSVRAAGGRSRRGRSAANAPRDGDWSSSSSSSSGPRAPPDFGQPHLFEWEVGSHRLLVESSLVVFRGEGRTPMSLKLVDLAAERPNTGAALSTWLDNTIAGVPELAVCYHRDGLIHHYDVLRTDDVARLCAPPSTRTPSSPTPSASSRFCEYTVPTTDRSIGSWATVPPRGVTPVRRHEGCHCRGRRRRFLATTFLATTFLATTFLAATTPRAPRRGRALTRPRRSPPPRPFDFRGPTVPLPRWAPARPPQARIPGLRSGFRAWPARRGGTRSSNASPPCSPRTLTRRCSRRTKKNSPPRVSPARTWTSTSGSTIGSTTRTKPLARRRRRPARRLRSRRRAVISPRAREPARRGARSNISPRRNAPSPEPPRRRTPRPPG